MHPLAIRKTSGKSKDTQKQHVAIAKRNPKAALAKRGISKKGKQMYYYKQGRKWRQKHASYLNGLPDEILVQIFKEVFTGVMMMDKTRIQLGDFRRKFGTQSLAFMNKKFKAIVETTMFKHCKFKLNHFRLHPKHHYTNDLATLPFIEDLEITWKSCANPRITTRQLHIVTIQSMVKLKVLTIDLKALSIQSINLRDDDVEFHGNIVEHLDSRADSMAHWVKCLILFGLTKYELFLKYYFTVTNTALSNGLHSTHHDDRIRVSERFLHDVLEILETNFITVCNHLMQQ